MTNSNIILYQCNCGLTAGCSSCNPNIVISSNTITPSYPSYSISSTSAINIKLPDEIHLKFSLPEKKMPNKVYVDGTLLTMGVLGSAAKCYYVGNGILIFKSNIFCSRYIGSLSSSLIIEYKNFIYDYELLDGYNSNKYINTKLLSKRKIA